MVKTGMVQILLIQISILSLAVPAQSRYYQGLEWEQLFNGQDLSGWKTIGEERWYVQDGAIVGESVVGEGGFVVTEREFTDFELHVRFKAETAGNSGVFYHTAFDGDRFANGMQVEVDPQINRHTGGLHEPRGRGWVVWPAPENETVLKPYDWNEMLVKVVDNRVLTRLNGVVMVDFTDPQPKNSTGVIGFQLHSSRNATQKIRFKDIWIRDLEKQ